MPYLWATALVILNAVWLAANVFGLPGNWLMILGAGILAWYYSGSAGPGGQSMFSMPVLVTAVVLAIIAEVLELVAAMAGARSCGATRRGAGGALIGGVAGAVGGTFVIPIPVVGSLIGAALGAAGGAMLMEMSGGKALGGSLKAGVGAGTGRLLGTVSKLAIGAAIWLLIAVAAFWP